MNSDIIFENNLNNDNIKSSFNSNITSSSVIDPLLIEKKIKDEFEDEYEPKIKIKSLDEFINLLESNEKYEGIKKYALGAYHPKDFNYHDKYSCGPQNNKLDKSNKIEDALRKNNIYCEESDYEQYIDNPIDDSGMYKIISSRRKACNCEYQRKLTLEHYKKNEPDKYDKQHQQAYNSVNKICNKCFKLEKMLKVNKRLIKQEVKQTKPEVKQTKPEVKKEEKKPNIYFYEDYKKLTEHLIIIKDDYNLYKNYNGKDNLDKLINYLYKNLNNIAIKLELNYKFQENNDFNNFKKHMLVFYYIFYKNHLQDLVLKLQKKQLKELNKRFKIKKNLKEQKLKKQNISKKKSKIKRKKEKTKNKL